MRMAHCPSCGGHNVNNYKKMGGWLSKCYDCGYTSEVPLSDRKLARYCWNLNYERQTGETLPDECCGRMSNSFMRKEKKAGFDKAVHWFFQEDKEACFE